MRKRTSKRAGPAARPPRAETRSAPGAAQEPKPRMQYERDQSSDSQASDEPSQRRAGLMAHHDIEQGLVDTDRGPVLEDTYERLRNSPPAPPRKLTP